MGRRALRKIDPATDLSRHLRVIDTLPVRVTAEALFGRAVPLEVEVGTGKGLFLRTAAATRPETCFVGVEIAQKYARFAAASLAKRGLANALVVHGDATRLIAERLPADSVAAVHVYFPDPWWKKRHHKRRVMRSEFLREVERVLVPGGSLHFWSDVKEYYHRSLEVLAETTGLEGPFDVPEAAAEHDLDYRTHFERRTRQHQQTVFRAELRKPPAASPSAVDFP